MQFDEQSVVRMDAIIRQIGTSLRPVLPYINLNTTCDAGHKLAEFTEVFMYVVLDVDTSLVREKSMLEFANFLKSELIDYVQDARLELLALLNHSEECGETEDDINQYCVSCFLQRLANIYPNYVSIIDRNALEDAQIERQSIIENIAKLSELTSDDARVKCLSDESGLSLVYFGAKSPEGVQLFQAADLLITVYDQPNSSINFGVLKLETESQMVKRQITSEIVKLSEVHNLERVDGFQVVAALMPSHEVVLYTGSSSNEKMYTLIISANCLPLKCS